MAHTIKDLRKRGFKVKVSHYRFTLADKNLKNRKRKLVRRHEADPKMFDPRGGKTTMEILFPCGRNVAAEVKCSHDDNYCRITGVNYCLAKLENEL